MLNITPSSPTPIYEQLIFRIREMIETGQLEKGESLPSIRKLAKQLDVASNTVARAYMELERLGLIVSNGRKGSFVKEQGNSSISDDQRIFKETLLKLIRKGYSKNEIINIFNKNVSDIFD